MYIVEPDEDVLKNIYERTKQKYCGFFILDFVKKNDQDTYHRQIIICLRNITMFSSDILTKTIYLSTSAVYIYQ